jgi:hypothetical protein
LTKIVKSVIIQILKEKTGVRKMKKILFTAIAILIFAGCQARTKMGASDELQVLSAEPDCQEYAEAVGGECACIGGYEKDDQGACVAEKIKLAAPSIPSVTVRDNNKLAFNAVKDINGEAVASGKVHFIFKKFLVASSQVNCEAAYTDPLDCNTGAVYSAVVTMPTGFYCIKAIACDDAYKPSEIMVKYAVMSARSVVVGDLDPVPVPVPVPVVDPSTPSETSGVR